MKSVRKAWPALVAGCLLSLAQGVALADYVEVLRDANVREEPNVRSDRLARVPEGALLALLDGKRTNDYFRVLLQPGDTEGWIHYSVVRKKKGDPPETFRLETPVEESREDSRDLAWWARFGKRSEDESAPAEPSAGAPRAVPQREIEVRSSVRALPLGNPRAFTERAGEGYAFVVDHRTGLPVWAQYEIDQETADGAGRLEARFFEDVDGAALPVLESPGWNALSGAVRGWVAQRGSLTVILGPVYLARDGRVSYRVTDTGQAVPTHLFKVLVRQSDDDSTEALGFLFENQAGASPLIDRALVPIDTIEEATRLDLLSALPQETQEALEAQAAETLW